MRILMVASEALPFAKTGGLGDVLAALPHALAQLGHHVDVVIPQYRGVSAGRPAGHVTVPLGPLVSTAEVSTTTLEGVRFVLLDHPGYFDREHLYGEGGQDYADNAERFAFLSRGALEWAATQPRYDVIHAHDWQTGLVPVYLRRDFATHPVLGGVPSVFTIHNLAYQGIVAPSWLTRLGLGQDLFHLDGLEFCGNISFLKGGVMFARTVTTVSPRYAEEIQTPEYGCGFDGIMRFRRADLVGIVNGIDYDQWDPAHDGMLPGPYDTTRLEGKRLAKEAALKAFDIPVTAETRGRLLVGMVSRMIDQKGFDLLAALATELPGLDATFVLQGTGERQYEDAWRALTARHPHRIAAKIGYSEEMAHLIIGGADLFLMPSRFEPCGLTQMYSQRYGTVPLVRATGGLVDTVRNLDPATGEGTGFMFSDYSPEALLGTLRWALRIYQDRAVWRRMQRAGMAREFSWGASARAYVQEYAKAAA